MKNPLSILSLAAAIIAFVSCSTPSHIEVAQGVNFSKYKTFGWANDTTKSGRVNNDIIDNNIKNSISAELEEVGWKETAQHPDVLLDYNVVVEKGTRKVPDPVYSYPYSGYYYNSWRNRRAFYYNPGFFMNYNTYNVPFKEGTLTVNMMDASTNKLIWQGWASGDITSNTVTSKEAKTDVKSIFKKFNLPATNS
jgi:hypothetical protein